ncbi:hypothetical protein BFP75_12590 [Maribacter sp. 4G9]|nr:hypothetical protein BFP75_12590 [Maribacter sp. 4G9]
MNQKKVVLWLVFIISLFIAIIIYSELNNRLKRNKIEQLNLQANGIITKRQEFTYGHDFGFVLVDIKKSNYRSGLNFYFFLFLEFFQRYRNECQIVESFPAFGGRIEPVEQGTVAVHPCIRPFHGISFIV